MSTETSSDEEEAKKNGFVFFGVGKDLDTWYNETIALLETEKMVTKADILIATYLKTPKNNCLLVLGVKEGIVYTCGWHTTVSHDRVYFGECEWIIEYVYGYEFDLYEEPTDLDLMKEDYNMYEETEMWPEEGLDVSSC